MGARPTGRPSAGAPLFSHRFRDLVFLVFLMDFGSSLAYQDRQRQENLEAPGIVGVAHGDVSAPVEEQRSTEVHLSGENGKRLVAVGTGVAAKYGRIRQTHGTLQ